MRRIHGPRVSIHTPKAPITVQRIVKNVARYLHQISQIYFSYRGNLLARGIAYSLLFTIIPSLFLTLYVGSIIFNNSPALQVVVQEQIMEILPVTHAPLVMDMVSKYMSGVQWRSMGITGIIMLIFTPHFLFGSVERALSLVMNPPEERHFVQRHLFYFLTPILVITMLMVFAFISVWIRKAGSYFEIPSVLMFLSSKTTTVLIMGLTLATMYRISYHHTINNRILFTISFGLATIWQLFSSSGSTIIAITGRNEVMYGVMTGAIVLLVLAYIFSVLLIVGGVIIGKESKAAEQRTVVRKSLRNS